MKNTLVICLAVILTCFFATPLLAQNNSNEIDRFSVVWDAGISGAENPSNPNGVKNLIRSWELEAGFDLDKDGLREIAVYDASDKVYFVYENTARGVNDYVAVFTEPQPTPRLFGGERGIMLTDMDHDGNQELVIVWDSLHPDSTDGFEALWVYEHVPGSGEFLPDDPQLKYDPPRSTEGRVALETQSLAGDFDFDGNVELVLTYRGGKDMLISVLEFVGDDIATGTFNVEFTDDGSPDGVSGTTPADSTAFINRVHGLNVGDLNGDGRPDFVEIPDTDPVEVRVYTTTGPDAWVMTRFDDTMLPPIYVTAKGSNTTPGIGDFNMDGYPEVYIIGRGKIAEDATNRPRLWVVSPAGGGFFDLSTSFMAANFSDLDVAEIVPPTEQNKDDLRGGFVGDGDNDGNLEVYISSRDLNSIFATEWVGPVGGDVTDPFNYQTTQIYNSKDDFPDQNIQFSQVQVVDLDGDGPNHFDMVISSPNGEQQGFAPSLWVLEFKADNEAVPDLGIDDPNIFTPVWDAGISGAENPSNPNGVKNLIRSWELETGFDLDKDGLREIAVYDASDKVYFVYENTARGVNDYVAVFTEPQPTPRLFGGERGIMLTDMDHDGNQELVIVWDSLHPDSTDGFEALWVYEHVPGSGEFLPDDPQLKYDPPRSTEGRVALETQSLAGDFDFDGNVELVLTYRGGKDMLISVLEFVGDDIATGTFNVEFTDDGSPDGVSGTTPADSTAFINRVHGLNVGDLNGDGRPDFVEIPDTDPVEVRVYTTTGPDAWVMTRFDDTMLPPIYVTAKGSNTTPGIGDFNMDGYPEVYIIGRGKIAEDATNRPRLWVVSPAGGGFFDLSTSFMAANFSDLDVAEIVPPTEQNKDDLRGGFVGDGDNDGNLEVYISSRDLNSIFATEWVGPPGGDVTDPFNYQTTQIYNSKDDFPDQNIQFSQAQVVDLDNDGPNNFDLVISSPNGEQQGFAPSLWVLEFNSSDVPTSVNIFAPKVIPQTFALRQNYPNPFNPSTNIVYELPVGAKVRLDIYNILGQRIKTLVDQEQPIGVHQIQWNGTDDRGIKVSSGVYVFVLKAGTFTESKKMLLLK
jgi:hypothetical protein